ncbi:MAG: hypothetical protein MAG431_01688 [Chloroflexi bacterium]|nr:hypothetical protein [Chloroflexota bacterium]
MDFKNLRNIGFWLQKFKVACETSFNMPFETFEVYSRERG